MCRKCNPGGRRWAHYNTQIPGGHAREHYCWAEKNPNTEVWFDIVPDEEDDAASFQTTVPFVPKDLDGDMSIVLHVDRPIQITGMQVHREACFPLSVPQWIPEPATTE